METIGTYLVHGSGALDGHGGPATLPAKHVPRTDAGVPTKVAPLRRHGVRQPLVFTDRTLKPFRVH